MLNIKYAFEDKTGIEHIVFFDVNYTFIGMIYCRFLKMCMLHRTATETCGGSPYDNIITSEVCQCIKDSPGGIPQPFLALPQIFQIGIVNSAGFVDALGKLIQIVAGVPEQGNQFLQLRQFQLNYIPINGHLADKGREIIRAELLHLLLDCLQFIRGHADDLQISCSFDFWGLALRWGCCGWSLSFSRTEGFFSRWTASAKSIREMGWPDLACCSRSATVGCLPLLMMPLSRIWDNGIINNGQKPTVSDLEQQVKNEQSISLMDLAEAVQQEKKPSVLKKLKEQPPQSASERKPRKTKEKEI